MNTPINFTTAKLLKEKGFDRYCDKKYIAQCLWQKPDNREKYKNSEIDKNSSDVAAPTIAEVLMWLYEKHGIWVWAEKYSSIFRPYAEENGDERFGKWEGHKYSTPTEAYEAAIIYTLKNLI